jgi:hypothetical protein
MSLIPPFTVDPIEIDKKTLRARWNRDWWLFFHNQWEQQGGTSDMSDVEAVALPRSRKGTSGHTPDALQAVPARSPRERKVDEVAPPRHSQPKLTLTKETYKPLTLIRLYAGLTADIPAGWQLADGTNGTPDLRDKFVVGAGNLYTQGSAGGSTTIAVTTTTVASGGGTTVVNGVTSPYLQPYYATAYIINTTAVTIVTDAKLR